MYVISTPSQLLNACRIRIRKNPFVILYHFNQNQYILVQIHIVSNNPNIILTPSITIKNIPLIWLPLPQSTCQHATISLQPNSQPPSTSPSPYQTTYIISHPFSILLPPLTPLLPNAPSLPENKKQKERETEKKETKKLTTPHLSL